MQKDHASSASSADGSSGLAASNDSVTATFDQDHSNFWPLSPGDIVSSWDWDEENLPGLLSVDKGTSSSSNGGAPLNCKAADAAIAHTPPLDVGNNANSSERACLCQRLADLSHSLSRDVHGLSSSLKGSDPNSLEQDGDDRIQRAFKAFETFGSLVDELRTTTTTRNLQAQAESLLTPVSNSRWSTFSSGNNVCQHGSRGAQASSKTTTAEVSACADHHLSMILALHIATSCACLNEILKRTLGSIHAALVSRQEGAGSFSAGQLPRLPRLPGIIRIEGLPGDSDHLRVRLFAETCLHVATGAHKRIELLAAAVGDTMRCGVSRPLDMVLGRGSCDESHVDIHGIKLLCSQISSAIEEHAW
ncbi:hypothetical protein CPLU01_03281 [Colletotrichum plurivorum]|uniref:Aflatoxin regulatory protein domain-containing protein n=1 Tax=Colletotrichum plurivorum TaxID=2175906 RepID=A0A8H6NKV4_9PEZI|nr:hypothetical protein CPLU01_03281 [Colletotrichum plurivorum]